MKVVIHQPEYLPWAGFWDRLRYADVFVALDTVTFQKNGFIHRNRIRVQDGWQWITVPLRNKSSFAPIKDIKIDNTKNWQEVHKHAVRQSYGEVPWFEKTIDRAWENISDLDIELLRQVKDIFKIDTRIIRSSGLHATGNGTELLLNICKELGADTYISGPGGKEYMEVDRFEDIQVTFHEYQTVENPPLCIVDYLHSKNT